MFPENTPKPTTEQDPTAPPAKVIVVEAVETASTDEAQEFGATSVTRAIQRGIDREQVTGVGPARSANEILETHEAQARDPEHVRKTLAERHPDWPKVRCVMYLSAHGTAEDFAPLMSIVDQEQPQIYLFEEAGGVKHEDGKSIGVRKRESLTDRTDLGLSSGVEGGIDAFIDERGFRGTYMESVCYMLDRRKIAVGTTDLTEEEEYEIGASAAHNAMNRPVKPELDKELEAIELEVGHMVEAEEKRNVINVHRFEDELERIFKERPDLKQRDSVTVVESFGVYHTEIVHALREDGIEVDTRFQGTALETEAEAENNPAYVYDYYTRLARTIAAGRKPDRALLEKVYLVHSIQRVLSRTLPRPNPHKQEDYITVSSYDRADYVNRIADELNTEDLRVLHSARVHNPDETVDASRARLDQLLAAHGASNLAQTVNELNSEVLRMREEHPTAADRFRDRARERRLGQVAAANIQ